MLEGPFTLRFLLRFRGDFKSPVYKLFAILWRFESPVVYTGDLKSPRNRAWDRIKNRRGFFAAISRV